MDAWEALLLGVIEGLTEFLPVSSTGHLLLAQRFLGLPRDAAHDAFAIVIQLGAIAAVLGLYRARVAQMGRGLLGRDPAGLRLLGLLLVAFLPAGLLGVLVERPLERHLFGLWPITAAWAVGGGLLLAMGRRAILHGRPLAELTVRGAWIVGFCQCAALLPGTSRSLVALVGGLLAGLTLAAAVELSFLLGVLTLGAAAVWKGTKHGDALLHDVGTQALVLGFLAAALAALVSVRWLRAWVASHGLAPFGWYRLGLAVVVTALLLAGVVDPG
jgi:undecaprenyl-diphosphatase